jgi:hypothetical protein
MVSAPVQIMKKQEVLERQRQETGDGPFDNSGCGDIDELVNPLTQILKTNEHKKSIKEIVLLGAWRAFRPGSFSWLPSIRKTPADAEIWKWRLMRGAKQRF